MPHVDFKYESASAKLEELGPAKTTYSLRNLFSRSRGQGHAKGVMQQIVQYADDNNITILLVIQRYGYKDKKALDNSQLKAFYEKFGFVTDPYSKYLTHMVRHPRYRSRENHGL